METFQKIYRPEISANSPGQYYQPNLSHWIIH